MKLRITVHGVAYEVDVEVLDPGDGFAPAGPLPPVAHRPAPARPAAAGPGSAPPPASAAELPSGSSSAGTVASPIAGTVVEVKCKVGDPVRKDQALLVIDAMKMHTTIASPLAGKVARINVAAGDSVRENQSLVEIE